MSQLICIDLLSYGDSHLKFNSSVLSALAKNGLNCRFYSEQTHFKKIVHLTGLDIDGKGFKKLYGWSVLREFYLILLILLNRKNRIIFFGSTGLGAMVISILFKIKIAKTNNIMYFCHSELEGVSANWRGIQKRLFGCAVHRLDFFKNAKVAVLSSHIKENLEREYGFNLKCVSHPPSLSETRNLSKIGEIKNIAIVGLIRSDTKDLSTIMEFSKLASKQGIRLYAYGRNKENLDLGAFICDETFSKHYTEDEVEFKLLNVDAILCCHKKGFYKFTASGAAFDWLHYGKIGLFVDHECFDMVTSSSQVTITGGSPQELLDKVVEYNMSEEEFCLENEFHTLETRFCNELMRFVRE